MRRRAFRMAASEAAHRERPAGPRPLSAVFGGPLLGLWLIVALLLLWELSARAGLIVSNNWPPVSLIAVAVMRGLGGGELLSALAGTIYRTIAGFVLGCSSAIVLGLLLSTSALARRMLEPSIELLRPLPIPALIPPLVLFLGLDDAMKITVVAFTVFFPVFVNTLHGARAIEPTFRAVAATFGVPWFATLRTVLLPATVPYIFAGLRISIGLAFVSAVAAEMVAGASGVGYYITSMQYAGRGADMFAALFLLGLTGYVINRAFVETEKRLLFWYHSAA
jgi:ABC-type nitrate/sulfonate/bicarbonate transport system permease component